MIPGSRVVASMTLVLLAGLAGCAATSQGVPVGQWTGRGTYVDCEAFRSKGSDTIRQTRSKDGVYETTLSIRPDKMFDRETLVIDVVSQRGRLLNMEDSETRIRMILVKTERLENGAQLYALADWRYGKSVNASPSRDAFEKRSRMPSASCVVRGGTSVLQVCYIVPTKDNRAAFMDTFVFEGKHVRKSGSIVGTQERDAGGPPGEEKIQGVYWTEDLYKK